MPNITNFWKTKPKTEKTLRKIYKGEVPLLGDDIAVPVEPETETKDSTTKNEFASSSSTNSQSQRKSESINNVPDRQQGPPPPPQDEDVDDYDVDVKDEDTPRPKSVKRHSITPAPLEPSKSETRDIQQEEKFPNNLVITSRYNTWNFLPKNLFEQFRRVVNFYFLVTAVIQASVDTPIHPATVVTPLAFVILVTAIKQGYEDWLRHKSDDHVNNRHVKVIRDGSIKDIKSRDIQVGDVVKLESDDQVPTDMVLLGCSDEFLRCQINTANLDGETNLKLRYCPSGLPHFKTIDDLSHLHVIIECEQPNADLYEFNGSLLIPASKLQEMNWSPTESTADLDKKGNNTGTVSKHDYFADLMSGIVRQGMTDFLQIPLSMENMLLRGTRLKNTEFILGIVVYTGKDTRLAKNSEKSQSKFSTVEKAVNYYLLFFVCMLAALATFSLFMHYFFDWQPYLRDNKDTWFAFNEKSTDPNGIWNTLVSFIILFNYIIPISLYVTIELQKFLGSKFFVWDHELVDEEGREPLCNTSDLNEELGQIEYLFSDKTGTMTKNVMQFRHCSIEALRYEYRTDQKLYSIEPNNDAQLPDAQPVNILGNKKVLRFFKTLALCHSVQVVPKRRHSFEIGPPPTTKYSAIFMNENKMELAIQSDSSSSTVEDTSQNLLVEDFQAGTKLEFQASSPDEKALLESCKSLGIIYSGEKKDLLTLDVGGQLETYKRLMVLEFDADRKCMSVIVENQDGEKWLFTKGAESSVVPRCHDGPKSETLKHVMDYALMGLRTLAVAVRQLTNSEYDELHAELRAARRLLKNRHERIRELYSRIENHMTLIGATGVLDQLQDHVPETLQAFAEAGIHVWMLTGDKLETAVNVAVSCGLITASTKQYIIDQCPDLEEICEKLKQIKAKMIIDGSENTCFVIDGESLAAAFSGCSQLLCDVSMKAFRVVCCRMAPLQKAQVVQMVKNSSGRPICCAVGDGANDCAMILAAHIGIGLLGKEGRQAARCADFAISKFGHMRRAVLVHGHWFYVRLSNLANYFFYKNVVLVMPQFFFSFNSSFATEPLFDAVFLMTYNIFFSSCPIFYYGLLEQPYSAETLLKNPHLYKKNKQNALMSMKNFLPWVFSALWHSAIIYYLPYLAWDNFDSMDNLSSFGTIVFIGLIIVTNLKMAIETTYFTWWYLAAQVYSFTTFFIITSIWSEMDFSVIGYEVGDLRNVYFRIMVSVSFWLLMLLVSVFSAIPDMCTALFKARLFQSIPIQQIRRVDKRK